MLNDIVDGVTGRLDELFEGNTIYTDGVEQGLVVPCFFVSLLEPSEKPMIGHRYFRNTGVSIQYIPEANNMVSRELARVADILMDGMEYIKLPDGSSLRGTGMKCSVAEGVLLFVVNYNMFVLKAKEESETMENVEVKGVIA